MNRCFKKAGLLLVALTTFVSSLQFPPAQAALDTQGVMQDKHELPEHRTANSKRFLNADGSFTEVLYGQPVHFKESESGAWLPIDSNLVTDEKGDFRNKANKFKITLKPAANGGYTSFELDGTALSFRPLFANSAKGKAIKNQVHYENTALDTDLLYTVQNNGLKEDILLKSPNAPSSFSYDMNMHGLTYTEEKDGSFAFYKAGETKPTVRLAKPFMVDANKQTSYDVTYKVQKDSQGKLTFDVIANAEWLKDPNRVYPVTIDPTVYSDYNVIQDTFVESNLSGSNFSSYLNNLIGNCVDHGKTRVLYQMSLPTIPSGVNISNATFHVWNNTTYEPDINPVYVDVYPYLSSWSVSGDNGITWAKEDDASLVKGGVVSTYQLPQEPGMWDIPVTKLVQDWYNGVIPNYGFKLQYKNESQVCRQLTASNDPTYGPAEGPYLEINYDFDGLGTQPFWTFNGPVNMQNRNLALGVQDFSFPGRQVEVSIERTYNSRSSKSGFFGYGWSSVLDMQLFTTASGPARLVDNEGTTHYFNRKPDGSYEPLPGLFWKLQVNGTSAVITTPDQTKYSFANGKVTSALDAAGNGVTLSASATQAVLQDQAGHKITFELSNGKVISALDPAGRKVSYSYENGNLVKVTRFGNSFEVYRYDNNHNLTAVVSPGGKAVYYAYNAEDRVIAVSPANAVLNSNFEVDADGDGGPDLFTYDKGAAGFLLDKASNSPYGQAGKLTASSTDTLYYKVYLSAPIQVDSGKPHTLSGWLRAAQTSGVQTTVLSVLAYDDAGTELGEFGKIAPTGTFDWKRESSTKPDGTSISLPAGAKTVRIKVGVSNPNGAGTSWYDAIQFEEAGKESDVTAGDLYTANNTNTQTARYDGDGNKELYTFNDAQNLIRYQKDPSGLNLKTEYSWSDNTLSTRIDPRLNKWTYRYDNNGNKIEETDPLRNIQKYQYDAQSNLTQFMGTRPNETYLYTYNNVRHQKTVRDPYYTSQSQNHDAYGNLLNETKELGFGDNQVDNSSFEGKTNADGTPMPFSLTDGQSGSWALSSDAKFGNQSLQLSVAATNSKKYVVLESAPLSVDRSETYVLAGYLKANADTGTQQSILSLHAYDSAGVLLGEVGRMSSQVEMDAWQRWAAAVQPYEWPANTSTVRVKLAAKNDLGAGSSSFDAIQFQKNPTDTAYNLLDNSSFESGTASGVGRWIRTNSAGGTFKWLTSPVYAGSRSVAIADAPDDTGFAYDQFIPYEQGKTYSLTAFVKTDGLSGNVAHVRIEQYDANQSKIIVSEEAASVRTGGTGDWKRLSAELTKEKDAVGTAYIRPVLVTGKATGTVYFDNVRLQAERVTTSYAYDPTSTWTVYERDAQGRETSYAYDNAGNVKEVVDYKGRITTNEYDALDRLISVALPGSDLKISRTYDLDGNLTSIKHSNLNGTEYNQTRFEYNAANQLSAVIDPLGRMRKNSYTPDGRLQRIDYPDGESISYVYGKTGFLNTVLYKGATRYSYGYDSSGNVNSVLDAVSGNTWGSTYDPKNRLIKWNDGKGYLDFELDDAGNLTKKTLTIGSQVKTETIKYNLVNVPIESSSDTDGTSKYLFDEDGLPSLVQSGNGQTDRRSYNNMDQVTEVRNQNKLGATVSSFEYQYDTDGNVETITDHNGKVSRFTYDSNRGYLTSELLPNGNTVAYQYDAVGNRISRKESKLDQTVVSDQTFTYNAANQLQGGYAFNDRGYLTASGTSTYKWDVGGRLTQVTKMTPFGFEHSYYAYDYLGRRVKQTVGGKSTNFLYDGLSNRIIAEYDGSGVLTKQYTWSPTGVLLSLTADGKTYYTVRNGRGDIVQLTDAAGEVKAWYQYDAWGKLVGHSNDAIWSLNPYRYAGYRYDDHTGLYYLNARYYDSALGRFLSPDPESKTPDYLYAENNPNRYTDPTGLIMKDQGEGGGGGGGGGGLAIFWIAGKAVQVSYQFTKSKVDDAAEWVERTVPNPWGKKGSPRHQAVVDRVVSDVEKRGLTAETEHLFDTRGGYKNRRYADVIARDRHDNIVEIHQVGRMNKNKSMVAREKKAFDDIIGSKDSKGATLYYYPYNQW